MEYDRLEKARLEYINRLVAKAQSNSSQLSSDEKYKVVLLLAVDRLRGCMNEPVLKVAEEFFENRKRELLESEERAIAEGNPIDAKTANELAKEKWDSAIAFDKGCRNWTQINNNIICLKDVESIRSKIKKLEAWTQEYRQWELSGTLPTSTSVYKYFFRKSGSLQDISETENHGRPTKKQDTENAKQLKALENAVAELAELESFVPDYRPKTVWDAMRLAVSDMSVSHFKEDMDLQDVANKVQILSAYLPPTSRLRADRSRLLKMITVIRNHKSHEKPTDRDTLIEYVGHIIEFLDVLYSEYPCDVAVSAWRDQFQEFLSPDKFGIRADMLGDSVVDSIRRDAMQPLPIWSSSVPLHNKFFTGRVELLEGLFRRFQEQARQLPLVCIEERTKLTAGAFTISTNLCD